MDLKNMGGLVGGLVVAIIMLTAVMIPVVGSTLVTAGDEVTLTNNTSIVLREVEEGDELKCVRTITSSDPVTRVDTWTLNDEEIATLAGSAASWNVGLMSDAGYIQINGAANSAAGQFFQMNSTTPSYFGNPVGTTEGTTTFTFTGGNLEVVLSNSATYTIPYTWGYVICPYADGKYCAAVSGGVGLVSSASEVVLCGAYTSGDNDTMYSYRNGTTYVSDSSYTMSVDIETELHEDTTDIYDATVSVDIGGETFTPYRILVPYEVTGHADSGAIYDMLKIMPLLVTVGIIIGIVGMMFARRE